MHIRPTPSPSRIRVVAELVPALPGDLGWGGLTQMARAA
jgi:hypothetical protein